MRIFRNLSRVISRKIFIDIGRFWTHFEAKTPSYKTCPNFKESSVPFFEVEPSQNDHFRKKRHFARKKVLCDHQKVGQLNFVIIAPQTFSGQSDAPTRPAGFYDPFKQESRRRGKSKNLISSKR